MVFMFTLVPVEYTVLAGARNAAAESLVNVDMLDTIIVLVVLDIEVNGRHGNGLPGPPANTLKAEDIVGIVA